MFVHRYRCVYPAQQKAYPSEEERREAPRYETVLGVRGENVLAEKCYGLLSLGGCDFDIHEPLTLGEAVHLRIYLMGMGLGLDVRGRVMRISAPRTPVHAARLAVRFDPLPFEKERLIARWLDRISLAFRATEAA